ncbi:M23 family metallopeptidase [Aquimarina sp. 2201CG14-23]|uniref:M23 family metallopeptidase n=1 Tax=Aquimarina mycalae TaxID=3040073 RepID=UPI002477DCAD|nr:M23 family metallopeptidase [Aquimarina sp. 2201CG14-23]MDH7445574.1 M23 family metallopeptidase [Aquimarina sp. 2201CG14-23]
MNKGKRSLLGILVCISFTTLSAQQSIQQEDNLLLDYKELVLDGTIMFMPLYKVPKQIEVLKTEKSDVQNDIPASIVFDEAWSNSVFNTYGKKSVAIPFELHFEDTVFSSPVEHKMVVTSRYGWRRGRAHQGIDIDLRTGDNVKSLLAGKVRYAKYHGGHGRTIVIRHNNGLETVYAHLSKYLVKENDIVEKGQIIGKGGVSGNARGSHLHLEVRYHGKSVHPEYLFDFSEETKIRSNDIAVTKKWMSPRSHKSTRKSKIVIYKTTEEIEEDASVKSIYVVKRGDTLHAIANKHDVEVSEICKINAIRYNSVLNVGQEILIN